MKTKIVEVWIRGLFLAAALLAIAVLAAAAQAADVFTSTGSLGSARGSHTATLLPNGKVLAAGGGKDSPGSLSTAELYDSATGTWSPTGSLGTAREAHTATSLPNGKVLAAGGSNFDPQRGGTFLTSAELYNPVTGIWSPDGSLTNARSDHTATLLPNGKVLVAGGQANNGPLANAELYDPVTGSWSATGSLGTGRFGHTATLLPNGKVLVSGGVPNDGFSAKTAELYDPASGTWSPSGSLATERIGHTATLLPNGKVLAAGGRLNVSLDDSGPLYLLASAELYDPATGTWSPTGSLGMAREYQAATLLPNGKVLVTGGFASNIVTLASAELYDPASGTWSFTESLVTGRFFHSATLLPNGQVLVAAGYYNYFVTYGSLGSAELYKSFLNPIFTPIKLGDGSFQFQFSNPSGPSYRVLASPNLAAPLNTWSNLGPATETSPGSGQFQFTDHQAKDYPKRFYRVSSP